MFYTFNQNNSGGSFIINEDLCECVIIEANDADHANVIAKQKGIYFNGCRSGVDCDCCGDRWFPAEEYCKHVVPSIYGTPALESLLSEDFSFRDNVIIYFLSEEKIKLHVDNKTKKASVYLNNKAVTFKDIDVIKLLNLTDKNLKVL